MKVKFANKTLECGAYIVIKNGMVYDICTDTWDYKDDKGCDIFPIDCCGEIVVDFSKTWKLKEEAE